MKDPASVSKSARDPNGTSLPGGRGFAREIYPIFLRLRDRRVLIVGGGEVALQRVLHLLATGAKITLIAPQVRPELERLAETGPLQLLRREFERTDVKDGYFLVIGATNHPPTQAALWEEAEKLGLLCNVVDDPQHCNYFTPAVVTRGDLKIAIGSAGQSPVLAGRLRQAMEEALPQDTDKWVEVLGDLRRELKKIFPHDMQKRKQMLDKFIAKASQPEE
jgi:precorrin-2 dehydrogenase/sirohydrochlorin ferrochelatase